MRLEGWEVRLAQAIEAARQRPFAWGQHDCATWAFDVREALTGEERPFPSYSTEAAGRFWMRRHGWRSFTEAATFILGEPVAPLMAQRGDIVLVDDPEAFGVCVGAQAAVVAPVGLAFVPLRSCRMAWRV